MRLSRSPRGWILSLALVGLLTACGQREFFVPDDVGQLVVDTVLIVDRPLPEIRLTRTLDPRLPFSFSRAGVRGATITVSADGGATVAYVDDPDSAGVYRPTPGAPAVLPRTWYRLRVQTSQLEELRATTFTPSRLAVDRWLLLDDRAQDIRRQFLTFVDGGDSLYDAPENQVLYDDGLLEARFAPVEAAAVQIALSSLDLDSDYVIDPDFFDEEDFESLDRVNQSPPLLAEDGFVRLPWFAIYFEGRYRIDVFAIDQNWYDLVRSSPQLNDGAGFGGNAGDSFDRPIFHVEGGIGLFGSAAADSNGFRILPNPR